MEVVTELSELKRLRHELMVAYHNKHFERPLAGLVPTMGALHRGHMSLIRRMVDECDVGMVSIFVNPRQFGPAEDLERYPRTLEEDLTLCRSAGAHIVYAPPVEEVYPPGYQTTVAVPELASRWCGAARPGHFDGVTTVVTKLFCSCAPDRAYFGEKDFQQLQILRRLTRDLDLPVEVAACATVREADGLAMSSRNTYLTSGERASAPRLFQTLRRMARIFTAGVRDVETLLVEGRHALNDGHPPHFQLEYLAVVDPQTLAPRETAQPGDRVLIAASLGETRLIDNIALTGVEDAKLPEDSSE